MRILITGGDGMLGTDLREVLKGEDLIVTNHESLDITDRNQVMEKIKEYKPEIVINCAAMTDVDGCETKKDLALIIEEVLKQRIQGVKNEVGVWITPAFPKLIYTLEEDNIYEDSPYYYLTELAAKCTAKRMVPDYISEKIML